MTCLLQFSELHACFTTLREDSRNLFLRYKAIVWPLRARNSKRCVVSTIIAIWLFSGLFAAPCVVFSTV